MCALTMEAVLNILGKRLFPDWENIERCLNHKEKLQKVANYLKIDLGSDSFQLFQKIFKFRDNLVHAKPSIHFTDVFHESAADENGFPVIENIPELLTDWEKLCNLEIAEKWRKAVKKMSSVLSEAAKCQDPVKIGGAVDIWGADWNPASQQVTFESLINIRPRQNNPSMEILDPLRRDRVASIVRQLLEHP